ncbi:MAG: glycerol-3-phosphate 1-O-acyltransferase PlsY [Clostridiales Family XIII bacterium]|jgi:glycerol-3-phosphate acyltransferase PlsY|nr:glycerol-3-phosphate 1-O-acyltransferase PlsY [Clostridiales Family XIII bacterium]
MTGYATVGYFESLRSIPVNHLLLALILVAVYFVGNFNPAITLGKARGIDIRSEGSGNAGTTNALRTMGKKAAAITFAVDVLKGFLPAALTLHFFGLAYAMLCGLAVMLGHMWPALYELKGGKGVATTFGVLLAVDPILALILIAIVLLTVAAVRMVSAGVILAAVAAIPVSHFFHPWYPGWILFVAALIVIKHLGNIKRILNGSESKIRFGGKEKKNSDSDGSKRG